MSNADDTPNRSRVFVVYGRNAAARTDVFSFLRAIGLSPIEWSQATKMTGKGAPFIGEILDAAFEQAQAVVVLMTGDDEARLLERFRKKQDPEFESTLTRQARPNVLFEAGMAFGRYPDRTILVKLGQLRPFSDVAGRHLILLSDSTADRQEFAQRLATAGCDVDLTGTDWHKVGAFGVSDPSPVAEKPDDSTDEGAGTSGLRPDAVDILTLVAQYREWVKVALIQQKTRLHPHRIEFLVTSLRDDKLLDYDGEHVLLTDQGREFLVGRNLI